MQAIHPSSVFQPPLMGQTTTTESACCASLDSLLNRISSVFAFIIQRIQALFSGQTESSPMPPASTSSVSPNLPPQMPPMPMPPVIPAAPIHPSVPVDRTQQFLNFYRGIGPDAQQRMLANIWAWNDNQLEGGHNYIQWLFPNQMPSAFNPQAPLLNDTIVQAFSNEEVLRNNLLTSFNRMLRFYGLQLDQVAMQITRAPNIQQRQAVLLTPGNHNYLRMTRMMICLNSLGFPQHAQAFYQILNDIAQNEGQNRVSQRTLQFWRNAARVD